VQDEHLRGEAGTFWRGWAAVVAEFVDGFAVGVATSGDETVVSVRGELDMATAPQLRDSLAEVLADLPTRLVVDARQLTFIDSTGLSALLLAQRRCRAQGGELYLREPTEAVRRLISLAGVESMLPTE
jgi:anti-sigma B factor antagonist